MCICTGKLFPKEVIGLQLHCGGVLTQMCEQLHQLLQHLFGGGYGLLTKSWYRNQRITKSLELCPGLVFLVVYMLYSSTCEYVLLVIKL